MCYRIAGSLDLYAPFSVWSSSYVLFRLVAAYETAYLGLFAGGKNFDL